ncbi:hypothetical protein GCM10009535_56410 [Streptomyces thermocarboxydovorans]|uniref:DUF1275 domain-containing protein n=1 Tax=Streptomyces thermocarboxydovorans TaxID=59298 RepID=A0ABP3SY30_9ACTN
MSGAGDVPVARPATTIGAFVIAAAVSAVVLKWLADRGRPWFPVGLTGEALLLAGGGAVVLLRHGTGPVGDTSDFFGIGLVALAMGVRASTALRMRVPGMPTLLSQTAIAELVNDVLDRPGDVLRGVSARQRLARTRWTATVVGIFLGGALATLLLVPLGTGRALLVIAVLVMSIAVFAMLVPLGER